MRIGLAITSFSWPGSPDNVGPALARIARDAERAGVSSLWVMDHFFQIPTYGPPEEPMLEGYSTLAFLAGQTERVELGTLVTGVAYRHPGILAKIVTTLDVLSGGRAWLGIGVAWNEQEARWLGVPFPPLGERYQRLEETLRIVRQMWAGDERPFEGRHYRLERPLNSPNALRRPHPPILVGGGGERRTLRLVARYADACNLFDAYGDEVLRRKLAVLREHCDAVGRPFEEIRTTTYGNLDVAPGDAASLRRAVERYHALAELGVDLAIVGVPSLEGEAAFEPLAELAGAARGWGG